MPHSQSWVESIHVQSFTISMILPGFFFCCFGVFFLDVLYEIEEASLVLLVCWEFLNVRFWKVICFYLLGRVCGFCSLWIRCIILTKFFCVKTTGKNLNCLGYITLFIYWRIVSTNILLRIFTSMLDSSFLFLWFFAWLCY